MAKEAVKGDIINRDKYGYERTRTTGSDGKTRTSTSNGDAVARALMTIPTGDAAIVKVMKDNDLHDKIKDHVGNLNPGQIRMIAGNALRAKVKKGESVKIGDIVVKTLAQTVKVPDAPAPAARAVPTKADKAETAKKTTAKRKVKDAAAKAA